jgi:hypothetical protein
MDTTLPTVLVRRIDDLDGFIVKSYILESWGAIPKAAPQFVKAALNKYERTLVKKGPLAIGFTFHYGNPTLDLFILKTPDEFFSYSDAHEVIVRRPQPWSEIIPIRIKKKGGLGKLEDFCETEQRILEIERKARENSLRYRSFEDYKRTFPVLDSNLKDSRFREEYDIKQS